MLISKLTINIDVKLDYIQKKLLTEVKTYATYWNRMKEGKNLGDQLGLSLKPETKGHQLIIKPRKIESLSQITTLS